MKMDRLLARRRRLLQIGAITGSAVAFSTIEAGDGPAQAAPLPSWNEGAARKSILDFVGGFTLLGSLDFVPVAERIAVFDNDGTLWSELLVYFQGLFVEARIKALGPQHPEWQARAPFASVLGGDLAAAAAAGEEGIAALTVVAHAGMTTDEFQRHVFDWIAMARHSTSGRLLRDMVYKPMLELLAYLRGNGFKTVIVSGGGIEFMRPWTEEIYGIQRHIGRRPIAAFGNSDGDLAMLQWTAAGRRSSLCLYVHHTDADREWAYDRTSSVGRLDKGLDEARTRGWTVVSMKDDWKAIHP